jgi:hypothetical protein
MFCIYCGASNPEKAKFCNACGGVIVHSTTPPETGEPDIVQQSLASLGISRGPIHIEAVQEPQHRRKTWLIILLVVGTMAVVGSVISKTDNSAVLDGGETAEFKMATIDSNGYMSKDDVRVARYRTLLDLLESKTGDPPPNADGNVGSAFVRAQTELQERGISESLLNLMEGMNQLIRPGKIDLLTDNLGVYVGVRSDLSLSHEQTISSMKKMGGKNIHLLVLGKIRPDGAGGLIIDSESGTYHFTAEMLH